MKLRSEHEKPTELMPHWFESNGKPNAIFNPNNANCESLPVIFGFNNGGSPDWWSGELLAEDGTYFGGHLSPTEFYMRGDLGVIEGTRLDRHEAFRRHYPNGYRMAFISLNEVEKCPPLLRAIELSPTA